MLLAIPTCGNRWSAPKMTTQWEAQGQSYKAAVQPERKMGAVVSSVWGSFLCYLLHFGAKIYQVRNRTLGWYLQPVGPWISPLQCVCIISFFELEPTRICTLHVAIRGWGLRHFRVYFSLSYDFLRICSKAPREAPENFMRKLLGSLWGSSEATSNNNARQDSIIISSKS